MKVYRFGNTKINVKRDTLSKMIDAAVSRQEFTKRDIFRDAGVSTASAVKLLTALNGCRFTRSKFNYPAGSKPFTSHSFSDNLSILVIDLSLPRYSMSIICRQTGCRFYHTYSYNPLMTFRENISAFLIKECQKAVDQPFGIAAICLIYADRKDLDMSAFSGSVAHLPSKSDLEKIALDIGSIFGVMPILKLTNAQAIKSAIDYGLIEAIPKHSAATYIYVGSSISVFYEPAQGEPIVCDIKNILINDHETLSALLDDTMSSEGLGRALYRIVNFTHCAYSAPRYVIEYDSLKFGAKTLRELKRAFVISGEALPEITALNHCPGLSHLGAAAASTAKLIGKHVTAASKKSLE